MDMESSIQSEQSVDSRNNWRASLAELALKLEAEGRACDRENRFVAKNLDALEERGFFRLGVPVELGGGGADYAELCAMLRELAAIDGSTALALSMHTHQVVMSEWKRRAGAPTEALLRRIANEGVRLVSSGGSDWLPGSGEALPVDGGYRIHARKVFASGSPDGDILLTSAVHGAEVLHFALPMNDPAVKVLDTWDTLGMRGTGSHDVAVEGVFIPEAGIAGRRPKGVWHPMFHMVTKAAMPIVYSVYAGIADGIREAALTVVRRKPAAEHVVALVGELESAHTALDLAHVAIVQAGAEGSPDPARTGRIMTLRGLVASSALRVGELALECAGGSGFYRREGIEQRFRDLQAARFHPLTDGQRRLYAGRLALAMSLDG